MKRLLFILALMIGANANAQVPIFAGKKPTDYPLKPQLDGSEEIYSQRDITGVRNQRFFVNQIIDYARCALPTDSVYVKNDSICIKRRGVNSCPTGNCFSIKQLNFVDSMRVSNDTLYYRKKLIWYALKLPSGGGGDSQTLSISNDTLTISGGNSVILPVYIQIDSSTINSYDVLNSRNAPPGSPSTGDVYLVGTVPTGVWVGQAKDIAEWNGSAWVFTDGVQGDFLYNATNALTYIFRSGNWVQTTGIPALNNGNIISSGLRIGTNNARSLTFETNNVNRGRFDSVGRFYIYDTSLRKANKYLQIDSITGRLVASEISGDFIPLSGTTVGNPVTGDIEFYNEGDDANAFIKYNATDGIFMFGTDGSYVSGASLHNKDAGADDYISVNADKILVESANPTYKGIGSNADYTANITDLDYTQKIYVDTKVDSVKILDTATITYADFYTAITGGNLVVGKTYIIMDFQTVYDQMDFDAGGSLKPTLVTKTGATEQIWVLALAPNQIASQAYSATYPNDKIQYDWTYNTTFVNGSPAKGRISERIDENNNRTDYDHREIKFIRYDDGAGNFTQINDSGRTSQEFLTFVQNFTGGTIKDNWLGDFYSIGALFGQEYGNNVFQGSFVLSNKSSAIFYNNTFSGGEVYNNTFSGKVYSNTFSGEVHSNTFSGGNVYNNTFSGNVYSNTFSGYVYSNTFSGGEVNNNTFSGNVDNNTFSDYVNNNTFSGIVYNNTFSGGEVNSNTFSGSVYNNTFSGNFYSNTFSGEVYSNTFSSGVNNNTFNGYVYNNTFSSYVYNNTFSGEVYNNTFSGEVNNNTFSGRVLNNIFTYTGYLRFITIADVLQNKTIDDTTYPFLFNTNYKKEILQASNGNNYIRYFDGTADVNTLIP